METRSKKEEQTVCDEPDFGVDENVQLSLRKVLLPVKLELSQTQYIKEERFSTVKVETGSSEDIPGESTEGVVGQDERRKRMVERLNFIQHCREIGEREMERKFFEVSCDFSTDC